MKIEHKVIRSLVKGQNRMQSMSPSYIGQSPLLVGFATLVNSKPEPRGMNSLVKE